VLLGGAAATSELVQIPVGSIRPNSRQPRRRLDGEGIDELAESIRAQGLVQPVVVRASAEGGYELIAGERRWRAAREAGLETVPALMRDDDEARRMETALIENVAREDLNPVDEARACAALVEELGLSKEELARRLGRTRPAISNLIRLLDLPDQVLELLSQGELSEGHGRAILQARGNDARRLLARDAVAAGWSVRETENRAKSGIRRRGPRALAHPDREAALLRAEEALEEAFGHGVKVRAAGGSSIRAELRFDSVDEVLKFARDVGRA
jgi:ParB family chromosome partitioning protein